MQCRYYLKEHLCVYILTSRRVKLSRVTRTFKYFSVHTSGLKFILNSETINTTHRQRDATDGTMLNDTSLQSSHKLYAIMVVFFVVVLNNTPGYRFTKGLTPNLNLRTNLKLKYNIKSLNYIQ